MAGAQGVIDLLRDVAEFAAQAIPGADDVGVALIDPRQGISSVQTWAATAVLVHEIDTVQYDGTKRGAVHHVYAVAATDSERIARQ